MNRSRRLSTRSESQPEPVVPTMSKMPIMASRLAALTSGMPASTQAGIRWVPIRPFVLSPQTKKLPNRSQKSPDRLQRAEDGDRPRDRVAGGARVGIAPGRAVSAQPDGLRPLRQEKQDEGHSSATAAATVIVTARQPIVEASQARSGRKTSWPLAVLAARMPITSPRLVTNQRLTMVAPSTIAMAPTPTPTSRPHSSTSCQGAVIRVVPPTARTRRAREAMMVRRTPTLCMRAAANGPMRP